MIGRRRRTRLKSLPPPVKLSRSVLAFDSAVLLTARTRSGQQSQNSPVAAVLRKMRIVRTRIEFEDWAAFAAGTGLRSRLDAADLLTILDQLEQRA